MIKHMIMQNMVSQSDENNQTKHMADKTAMRRGANYIASALVKILEHVVQDHPDATEIVTWSDSCVPQNRNSIIAFAMADFLTRHPQIKRITMKYSTSGHSAVQEVDNMHSHIEKAMAVSEFYSPLSFLRVLLKVNRNNETYEIIQMKSTDLYDFQACSKLFQYKEVPFSEVSQLVFDQCPYTLHYTKSHAQLLCYLKMLCLHLHLHLCI